MEDVSKKEGHGSLPQCCGGKRHGLMYLVKVLITVLILAIVFGTGVMVGSVHRSSFGERGREGFSSGYRNGWGGRMGAWSGSTNSGRPSMMWPLGSGDQNQNTDQQPSTTTPPPAANTK